MGKYYITGNAGTGKSSVISELKNRGYSAYDIDELPEIHGYLDRQTNIIFDALPHMNIRGEEAFARYASILKSKELVHLLETEENIFLGGSVTNQAQFYPLFDEIFGLLLNKATLEHRLATRTNNPTGNDLAGRAYLVGINDRVQANLQKAGATIVDATQPLEKVVNEILSGRGLNDNLKS